MDDLVLTEDKIYKVLIVDDEPDTRHVVHELLRDRFKVLMAEDGEEGVRIARSEQPELIFLDIKMPKVDGFSACRQLRSNKATQHIPVIMLTAADDVDSKVRSYMTGADNFLVKPFAPNELIAHIDSKIRRIKERDEKPSLIGCGNLSLNLDKLEASLNGKPLRLSVLEFELLLYFIKNRDRVLSRDQILQNVWRDTVVTGRTVDTHLVSLRKKLIGFDHALATIYGAGYILKKD